MADRLAALLAASRSASAASQGIDATSPRLLDLFSARGGERASTPLQSELAIVALWG